MDKDYARTILEEIRLRAERRSSLEDLLTSPTAFGLTTATPLQRAICRIADGQPLGDLRDHPDVLEAIGDPSLLPARPREIYLIAGIRTAKSLFAAALAYRATQTVDVSHLGHGERARVFCISLDKDKAAAVYNHFVGNIKRSPSLSGTLVDEKPSELMAVVRSPSGHHIEFLVLAGRKAGGAAVSRWVAGAIYDEAPRMTGRIDGEMNLEDNLTAVRGRLLDGAQIVCPGSPWAPFGPIYNTVEKYWKKPADGIVVIRADARRLNPLWWTPERCEALKKADEDAYHTDVEAEFLDREENLFSRHLISQNTRENNPVLPPWSGWDYAAAMDPGTRSNAWTFVITTHDNDKHIVVLAREWQGSTTNPLSPRFVLREIAAICREYGIDTIATDQWSSDAIRDIALEFDMAVFQMQWTQARNAEEFMKVRDMLASEELELPPNPTLNHDLRMIRRRITQTGMSILLPKTEDGRHCDYAPALVRSLAQWKDLPQFDRPEEGTVDFADWEAIKMEEQELEAFNSPEKSWWEGE